MVARAPDGRLGVDVGPIPQILTRERLQEAAAEYERAFQIGSRALPSDFDGRIEWIRWPTPGLMAKVHHSDASPGITGLGRHAAYGLALVRLKTGKTARSHTPDGAGAVMEPERQSEHSLDHRFGVPACRKPGQGREGPQGTRRRVPAVPLRARPAASARAAVGRSGDQPAPRLRRQSVHRGNPVRQSGSDAASNPGPRRAPDRSPHPPSGVLPGLRRELEHLRNETVVWLRQFEPGSNSADANRLLDRLRAERPPGPPPSENDPFAGTESNISRSEKLALLNAAERERE